jgi:hypothetical protein
MNDRVDAIGATILAVGAATVAAMIFGSVPFSVLDQHAFAYAVMSLTMGVIAAVAFFALIEFVLVPVVDRIYWAPRAARQERERKERIYRSWSVTRDQR